MAHHLLRASVPDIRHREDLSSYMRGWCRSSFRLFISCALSRRNCLAASKKEAPTTQRTMPLETLSAPVNSCCGQQPSF
jgi:hypothetical protein